MKVSGSGEKKELSYATFEYYYQRACLRCNDLFLSDENDLFMVFRLTLMYSWTSYLAHMRTNGEETCGFKHTPNISLIMGWAEEKVNKTFGRNSMSDSFLHKLDSYNEIIREFFVKYFAKENVYLKPCLMLIVLAFVQSVSPKEYAHDMLEKGFTEEISYAEYLIERDDYMMDDKYQVLVWCCMNEVIHITDSVDSLAWTNPDAERYLAILQ